MIRQVVVTLAIAVGLTAQTQIALVPAAKDNTLIDNPFGALSNGAGPHVFAGQTIQGSDRRAVIAFAVAAAIPSGSTIQSASLRLEMDMTIAMGVPISLHQVTQDWGEGTSLAGGGGGLATGGGNGAPAGVNDATWLHTFSPTSSWSAPGGDFTAAASATTTVNQNGPYTWAGGTVTSDVQSWLNNPATNFGWLIKGPGTASPEAKRFRSREHPQVATRPLLAITFTPPTGASSTISGYGCPVTTGAPGFSLSLSAL